MNCIVRGVTKSWTQLNNFPFQSNQNCMHWHTDEHTYHWNKIQSPEINSYCSYLLQFIAQFIAIAHICEQLISNKGTKTIQ